MKKHTIDTDATPKMPFDGAVTEEHKGIGKLEWNPKKINLWLSEKQKEDWIDGNELRKLVPNPLNATVLDFLVKNPKLWPEEWKGKWVYFWGTIFRRSGGDLYVRYGYWSGGEVVSSCSWLGGGWSDYGPSASLASPLNLETGNSLESLSLDSAIEMVKKAGYKIFKEI